MLISLDYKKYLACEDGFYGNHCAVKCPMFGKKCLSWCPCDI